MNPGPGWDRGAARGPGGPASAHGAALLLARPGRSRLRSGFNAVDKGTGSTSLSPKGWPRPRGRDLRDGLSSHALEP